MESNKNDNNNGGDQHQHQQLRGNARKRTFNELANDVDDDQPADEDQQREPENCSKKNRGGQRGNDALENLHLENLTREEMIQLVRKQSEAHKQLETTAGKSAKQAEEFSQRILQLEQEKAEVHAELGKKVAEIVEKSGELAEKAKQIDALLLQLNESTSHQHQIGLPTEHEQQMKIQLSLETWYDWLAFVPRRRLGKIVPKIGDRKFASIIQKFLHEYGEIMIDYIEIVAPYEEDSSGPHPRVRAWQNNRLLRFEMAETQMPTNIKNVAYFELRYFDHSVLNFMQKFQQKSLLENVTLWFDKLPSKAKIQPVLFHLLPLINGIGSILLDSAQLVDFYDAGNSKEFYEMNMKMMEKTRILGVSYDLQNFEANRIDLYCRWLYQTARADGKPRMLVLYHLLNRDYASISLFIDRLKQDFLKATDPATFFIRISLPKTFHPLEDICLDNGKTNERLLTKMEKAHPNLEKWGRIALLISRFPLASTKKWIMENQKEVLDYNFKTTVRTISLTEELTVVAI